MEQQQFSLSWREFQGNLSSGCSRLLGSGEFADVTLAVEGKLLQAHKVVLSICSPYFKKMFHANPCQHPIIVLKDISYNSLKDLLHFMYNGEVSVRQEDLTNFISTAESLEIKGLTNNLNTDESNNPPPPRSPVNNNLYKANHVDKSENFHVTAVNDDESPQNLSNTRLTETLNPLKNLAPLKRKSDSFLNKSVFSADMGLAVQSEKRQKLREKHILNRHKIMNSYAKNIANRDSPLPLVCKNDSAIRSLDVNRNSEEESPVMTKTNDVCNVNDVKMELDANDSALNDTQIKSNDITEIDDDHLDDIQLPSPPIMMPDGVDNSLPGSPLAQWPGGLNKGFVPFSEHRIVTIPQKEDGKKKYPQKSCRYCWKAGRRRDTRFMCEQCCVPLCKLVCFEKHQSLNAESLSKILAYQNQ